MSAAVALLEPQHQPQGIAPDAGHLRDLPAGLYHKHEALSASGAKKLLRSPAHYLLMRTQPSVPTEAMRFGTAVHAAVLEPDTFADAVVQAPDINRRTTAGRAEHEAFQQANAGKVVLSADDMMRVYRCVNAVHMHPAASKLLTGGEVEGSLFWVDGEYRIPCKARFDKFNHGGMVDLKTCQDASQDGFGRAAASLLYHVQNAHYIEGAEAVLNETPRFFSFVCVEVEPPHCVAVYVLPTAAVLAGRHLLRIAMERYAECSASGKWEGYPDTIEMLDFPKWALRFGA